ncbi:MAG: LPS-assembly protein LptD [Sulfuricurvum sp.]
MRKYLIFAVASVAALIGGDRVELIGTNMDANGSLVHASSSPVIIYQNQILSADALTYDRNTSIIEASGNVNVFKAGQYHGVSEYSRLNLESDTRYSKPYYMIDHSTGAWMSSDEASGCQSKIDLASGMVSGCNSTDPLWKIYFSSADYDTESMWVNIYNARLYIQDIPVMYFPYFGYPTDHTRRSGLLMPSFGLSNVEGIYYEQPIYLAPSNSWDVELRPQIRTLRGSGIYADLRFVDTASSKGSIRLGYFKEQSDYVSHYNLANDHHYGYGVSYTHNAFLKEWFDLDLEGESGLYVNGSWMNDVDYLNLQQSNETKNVTSNQIFSRINGYYSSEDNYAGMYFKHYQYLDEAIPYSQTIQTLPTLHYHRYLENFLGDHLLLNGDVTASNFYRPDGIRAVQGDINIPIMLQTSLFDDYLDVSYTANGSARAIGFYGSPRAGENESLYSAGYYGQLDHIFSMGSTLIKPYETFTHVVTPNISYTRAGSRYYSGYYKEYESLCDNTGVYPCEFYTLNKPSDALALGVNNYLFEGGKQWLVDRLSQTFKYDDGGSYYGELQNELEWQVTSAISLYNQTSYNHDRNRITKEQNTLRYNDTAVSASISHYYTDEIRDNQVEHTSYLTADAAYQANRYYRIFGQIAYDYQQDLLKRSEIGFLYTQRCFDFGLKFVQNIRPILTNGAVNDSVNDSYVFITVILKPLGGSEFNYKLTNGQ